ncbi:murein hydrolase activator EnvC [Otariodibacter sp.]|uniref:murein hydrolase activator EnvC n=1 Tax=Otariodibacter sp. TaxID=3030919 RepID=UPI002625393D|nr:murein hydrolase activator EnvC [Otariodibacter sp.]
MKFKYSYSLLLCLFGASSGIAYSADLSQLQKQINQQQQKINQQQKERDSLQSTLKKQELQIGQIDTNLKKIESNISEIRKTIKTTEQEIQKLEQQELQQKEKLQEQLDSAYRSGIHPSTLERLFSKPAKDADRMGAYYEHINKVRIDAINELHRIQSELKTRRDDLNAQQAAQQAQLSEQKKQESELKKTKAKRESTIRSIDKTLVADKNRLQVLKNNEAILRRQIEQAMKEAEKKEQQEIALLDKKKKSEGKPKATEQEKQQVRAGSGLSGKYNMPINGKIVNHFGSPQIGELKWDAIVIEAKTGTPVKAITDGRVVLASWLQGYGQLVAIDHGKGYMSFYGYNQSIAVKKDSRVKAGQTIAYVGNSGGQDRSALYFAIRRKGVAVNPLNWVK